MLSFVGLTIDWRKVGRGGRHTFHILKNIQFAFCRINFCICTMTLLILQGQTGNHVFAVVVSNYLYSHDRYSQIGGWCMTSYGKIFVLLLFLKKLVIDVLSGSIVIQRFYVFNTFPFL